MDRDPLTVEVERLARRVTELVPQVIRDPRFDPDDVVVAKAASVGLLHLFARTEGKPTPYEVYGYDPRGNPND